MSKTGQAPETTIGYLEYWYAALRAEIGVRITTDNVLTLKQALYAARREADDPDLQALSLTACPTNPTGELWIIKKAITVEVPDEELNEKQG